MTVAMLAVLKAGGAFVPLDASHPLDRLRGLCTAVDAKLVLCSSHLIEKLSGLVETVLPLDDATVADAARVQSEAAPASLPTISSSTMAYVIFTSGSTGNPKVSFLRDTRRSLLKLTLLLKSGYHYRTPSLLLRRTSTRASPRPWPRPAYAAVCGAHFRCEHLRDSDHSHGGRVCLRPE